MPRLFLQIEGLTLLIASIFVYSNLDFGWGVFALLLFVPDLPLMFYALNKNLASVTYNLVHTMIFPIFLGLFSYSSGYGFGIQLALIWLAHIGMDHVFGYGFKYLGEMKETHFSRI
jgi:hypothetical protein